MAISVLVITITNHDLLPTALTALAAEPSLTLGERFGLRVAAIAETPSVDADRALIDALRATVGITNVDIAYVHLDAYAHNCDHGTKSATNSSNTSCHIQQGSHHVHR